MPTKLAARSLIVSEAFPAYESILRPTAEDGRRLAVRNGYHQSREVLTSAGAVEVSVPRVNDKRTDPDTSRPGLRGLIYAGGSGCRVVVVFHKPA
jgi:hypothetical protein